jgi:hypothetical protein
VKTNERAKSTDRLIHKGKSDSIRLTVNLQRIHKNHRPWAPKNRAGSGNRGHRRHLPAPLWRPRGRTISRAIIKRGGAAGSSG